MRISGLNKNSPSPKNTKILCHKFPIKPKNNLGAYMSPAAPTTEISYAVLATRYHSTLSASADLAAIRNAHDQILAQQAIADSHSPVVLNRQISEASEAYARNPGEATLTPLRHLKTLSEQDFCLTQHFAREKKKEILAAITPELKKVMARGAELVADEAIAMDRHDAAFCEAFGTTFEPSRLSASLSRRALEFRNASLAEQSLDGFPPLVEAVIHGEAK